MIGLELYVVNGDELIQLLLPDNFSAEFEWQNPALLNSEIPSEISFDIQLPIEGNELALKQSHHIETNGGDSLFEIRGFVNGETRINGKLYVENTATDTDSDFFDCAIISSDFNSLIQGKTLRDVCDTVVLVGDGSGGVYDQIKFMNESDSDTYPCAFPVMYNPEHYKDENPNFTGFINPWLQSAQVQIQTGTLPGGSNYYENEYTYVPTMYLVWVLDQIAAFTGWKIGGSAISTPEFKKVILFSNHGIEKNRNGFLGELRKTGDQDITNGYVFFDEILQDEDGTISIGATPYEINQRGIHQFRIVLVVGDIDAGSATLHVKTAGLTGDGFEFAIPAGNQVYVIDQEVTFSSGNIGDDLGCLIDSGGQNIEILTNTTFKCINVTESSSFTIPKNFNAQNCVPKMGVGEFLLAMRNWMNIKISMNPITRTLDLDFCKDILANDRMQLSGVVSIEKPIEQIRAKLFTVSLSNEAFEWDGSNFLGSYDTIDDLPDALSKQVALVRNLSSYYIFDIDTTENALRWRFFALADTSFSFGDGEEVTITIPGELVRMENVSGLAAEQIIPVFSEEGSGNTYDLGIKNGKLRFGFFHGLQAGSVGDYPFASTSNLDKDGNSIAAWNFMMEDVDGVGAVLYGDWKKVMLSIRSLVKNYIGPIDLQKAANQVIFLDHQEYILESVVRLEGNTETPIELTLRKIPV